MPTPDVYGPALRDAFIAAAKRGEALTMLDAARVAGCSRQRAYQWSRNEENARHLVRVGRAEDGADKWQWDAGGEMVAPGSWLEVREVIGVGREGTVVVVEGPAGRFAATLRRIGGE